MSRIARTGSGEEVALGDTLIKAGLEPKLAKMLEAMPYKTVTVEPRRPFREPGVPRNEVMFVRSGLLSIKAVNSGWL